jgi:hypothetical protein
MNKLKTMVDVKRSDTLANSIAISIHNGDRNIFEIFKRFRENKNITTSNYKLLIRNVVEQLKVIRHG